MARAKGNMERCIALIVEDTQWGRRRRVHLILVCEPRTEWNMDSTKCLCFRLYSSDFAFFSFRSQKRQKMMLYPSWFAPTIMDVVVQIESPKCNWYLETQTGTKCGDAFILGPARWWCVYNNSGCNYYCFKRKESCAAGQARFPHSLCESYINNFIVRVALRALFYHRYFLSTGKTKPNHHGRKTRARHFENESCKIWK